MIRIKPNKCGYGGSKGYTCTGIPSLTSDGHMFDINASIVARLDAEFNKLPKRIKGMVYTEETINMAWPSDGPHPEVAELSCKKDTDPESTATDVSIWGESGIPVDVNGQTYYYPVYGGTSGWADLYNSEYETGESPVYFYRDSFVGAGNAKASDVYIMTPDGNYGNIFDVAGHVPAFTTTIAGEQEYEMGPGLLEPMLDTDFDPIGIDTIPSWEAGLDAVTFNNIVTNGWRSVVDDRFSNIYARLNSIPIGPSDDTALRALKGEEYSDGDCSNFIIHLESGSAVQTVHDVVYSSATSGGVTSVWTENNTYHIGPGDVVVNGAVQHFEDHVGSAYYAPFFAYLQADQVNFIDGSASVKPADISSNAIVSSGGTVTSVGTVKVITDSTTTPPTTATWAAWRITYDHNVSVSCSLKVAHEEPTIASGMVGIGGVRIVSGGSSSTDLVLFKIFAEDCVTSLSTPEDSMGLVNTHYPPVPQGASWTAPDYDPGVVYPYNNIRSGASWVNSAYVPTVDATYDFIHNTAYGVTRSANGSTFIDSSVPGDDQALAHSFVTYGGTMDTDYEGEDYSLDVISADGIEFAEPMVDLAAGRHSATEQEVAAVTAAYNTWGVASAVASGAHQAYLDSAAKYGEDAQQTKAASALWVEDEADAAAKYQIYLDSAGSIYTFMYGGTPGTVYRLNHILVSGGIVVDPSGMELSVPTVQAVDEYDHSVYALGTWGIVSSHIETVTPEPEEGKEPVTSEVTVYTVLHGTPGTVYTVDEINKEAYASGGSNGYYYSEVPTVRAVVNYVADIDATTIGLVNYIYPSLTEPSGPEHSRGTVYPYGIIVSGTTGSGFLDWGTSSFVPTVNAVHDFVHNEDYAVVGVGAGQALGRQYVSQGGTSTTEHSSYEADGITFYEPWRDKGDAIDPAAQEEYASASSAYDEVSATYAGSSAAWVTASETYVEAAAVYDTASAAWVDEGRPSTGPVYTAWIQASGSYTVASTAESNAYDAMTSVYDSDYIPALDRYTVATDAAICTMSGGTPGTVYALDKIIVSDGGVLTPTHPEVAVPTAEAVDSYVHGDYALGSWGTVAPFEDGVSITQSSAVTTSTTDPVTGEVTTETVYESSTFTSGVVHGTPGAVYTVDTIDTTLYSAGQTVGYYYDEVPTVPAVVKYVEANLPEEAQVALVNSVYPPAPAGSSAPENSPGTVYPYDHIVSGVSGSGVNDYGTSAYVPTVEGVYDFVHNEAYGTTVPSPSQALAHSYVTSGGVSANMSGTKNVDVGSGYTATFIDPRRDQSDGYTEDERSAANDAVTAASTAMVTASGNMDTAWHTYEEASAAYIADPTDTNKSAAMDTASNAWVASSAVYSASSGAWDTARANISTWLVGGTPGTVYRVDQMVLSGGSMVTPSSEPPAVPSLDAVHSYVHSNYALLEVGSVSALDNAATQVVTSTWVENNTTSTATVTQTLSRAVVHGSPGTVQAVDEIDEALYSAGGSLGYYYNEVPTVRATVKYVQESLPEIPDVALVNSKFPNGTGANKGPENSAGLVYPYRVISSGSDMSMSSGSNWGGSCYVPNMNAVYDFIHNPAYSASVSKMDAKQALAGSGNVRGVVGSVFVNVSWSIPGTENAIVFRDYINDLSKSYWGKSDGWGTNISAEIAASSAAMNTAYNTYLASSGAYVTAYNAWVADATAATSAAAKTASSNCNTASSAWRTASSAYIAKLGSSGLAVMGGTPGTVYVIGDIRVSNGNVPQMPGGGPVVPTVAAVNTFVHSNYALATYGSVYYNNNNVPTSVAHGKPGTVNVVDEINTRIYSSAASNYNYYYSEVPTVHAIVRYVEDQDHPLGTPGKIVNVAGSGEVLSSAIVNSSASAGTVQVVRNIQLETLVSRSLSIKDVPTVEAVYNFIHCASTSYANGAGGSVTMDTADAMASATAMTPNTSNVGTETVTTGFSANGTPGVYRVATNIDTVEVLDGGVVIGYLTAPDCVPEAQAVVNYIYGLGLHDSIAGTLTVSEGLEAWDEDDPASAGFVAVAKNILVVDDPDLSTQAAASVDAVYQFIHSEDIDDDGADYHTQALATPGEIEESPSGTTSIAGYTPGTIIVASSFEIGRDDDTAIVNVVPTVLAVDEYVHSDYALATPGTMTAATAVLTGSTPGTYNVTENIELITNSYQTASDCVPTAQAVVNYVSAHGGQGGGGGIPFPNYTALGGNTGLVWMQQDYTATTDGWLRISIRSSQGGCYSVTINGQQIGLWTTQNGIWCGNTWMLPLSSGTTFWVDFPSGDARAWFDGSCTPPQHAENDQYALREFLDLWNQMSSIADDAYTYGYGLAYDGAYEARDNADDNEYYYNNGWTADAQDKAREALDKLTSAYNGAYAMSNYVRNFDNKYAEALPYATQIQEAGLMSSGGVQYVASASATSALMHANWADAYDSADAASSYVIATMLPASTYTFDNSDWENGRPT